MNDLNICFQYYLTCESLNHSLQWVLFSVELHHSRIDLKIKMYKINKMISTFIKLYIFCLIIFKNLPKTLINQKSILTFESVSWIIHWWTWNGCVAAIIWTFLNDFSFSVKFRTCLTCKQLILQCYFGKNAWKVFKV